MWKGVRVGVIRTLGKIATIFPDSNQTLYKRKEKEKMNIERFREIIKERIYVEKISKGEWQDGIDKCWKKEIEILSEDISSSIYFLNISSKSSTSC